MMDDMDDMDDTARFAEDAPGPYEHDEQAPQLRTILLLDIVDSTSLVERLGDTATAQLFREHDRLVLRLQQQWRGRLIDRSDGLLLLFERPIDGLGFALDYGRGLDGIGQLRDLEIKARAGLHVGEVLTWRNSDESVRLGAKPVEVEGLAKPMAARLMSIARPGQVLLSAVAEPLVHRAARDLGERGQALVWKSHGRWRLKGVPEPQEIFEVGEPGVTPLRRPVEGPKAQRDVPLWRRPAALLAEAAVVAAVAIGGWFATQPPPAIAFNERDWVVVGDLRNLTGDTRLDDSLEQAFRISLEQSRFVNVLPDLKVRDTLARMRLQPGVGVDRGLAAQIAQRDGARAVILPTVSEVGGRLRFSVEVVDPHSQATVYAHAADGKGEASVLASIDEVTGALRADLGEAIAQIDRDSKPLPEVTTGNLDALRAYALGQEAYAKHRFDESLQLFERATELDSKFALAWLGQVRTYYSQVNAPAAVAALRRAQSLSDRLPVREAMYVEGWVSEFDDPASTTRKWVELARLYPDFAPGQGNAAIWLYEENRFEQALEHARSAASERNVTRGQMLDMVGRALLGMGRFDEADEAFRQAIDASSSSTRRRLATAAAKGDFVRAREFASELERDNPDGYLEKAALAIDLGRWDEAKAMTRSGLGALAARAGLADRYMRVPAAVASWMGGDLDAARSQASVAVNASLLELSKDFDADARDNAGTALAAALLLQRLGDYATGRSVIDALSNHEQLMKKPQLAELAAVLRAQLLLHDGRPEQALALVEPLLTGHERYQTRVTMLDIAEQMRNRPLALEQARWLQENRGLAYIELECGYCLQALNVADSVLAVRREAALLRDDGQQAQADLKMDAFQARWSVPPSIPLP